MALNYDKGGDNNSRDDDDDSKYFPESFYSLLGEVTKYMIEWARRKIRRASRATGGNAGWGIWSSFPGACRLRFGDVLFRMIHSTGRFIAHKFSCFVKAATAICGLFLVFARKIDASFGPISCGILIFWGHNLYHVEPCEPDFMWLNCPDRRHASPHLIL